jgi:hypothetical protein
MSLTDIMSYSDLSWYPQIALVIFLAVFAATSLRVLLSRRRTAEYARAATLPLDEGIAIIERGPNAP